MKHWKLIDRTDLELELPKYIVKLNCYTGSWNIFKESGYEDKKVLHLRSDNEKDG